MHWNCGLTEERLSDYVDGALAPEEREACEAHSANCAACAQVLARVGDLVARMHALEPLLEPAFLERRIVVRTTGTRAQRHEIASVTGWFNLLWQPRFAMGFATVAATFVILAHAAGLRLSSLKPSDLNPLSVAREANRQAHLTYARGEKFVNDLRVVYEIRAVLAAPQPVQPAPQNRATPPPSGASPNAPDTLEHGPQEFQRDAAARSASNQLQWAMLDLAFEKLAPHPANRRPL
jgi:anti-sigma factor RsiW